eukprot:3490074-Amphidinium_carterae.1
MNTSGLQLNMLWTGLFSLIKTIFRAEEGSTTSGFQLDMPTFCCWSKGRFYYTNGKMEDLGCIPPRPHRGDQ